MSSADDSDGGILSTLTSESKDDGGGTTGVITTDWVPRVQDLQRVTDDQGRLPEQFRPGQGDGMIRSLVRLFSAGVGSVIVAFWIGIASIPAGLYIAFENVLRGVRTFAIEFFAVFFQPFQIGADCMLTAGQECTGKVVGIESTNIAIAGAGVLGFAFSIVTIGAMAYISATVVGNRVGW